MHFPSWISYEMDRLCYRCLGPKWRYQPAGQTLLRRVDTIPAGQLWPTHERRRERLVAFARRRRVFLEDSHLTDARYLVQGVHVRLNTPERPMEAGGTNGMKAAANGALTLTALDGWWHEACPVPEMRTTPLGRAIGSGQKCDNPAYRDQVESEAPCDLP